MKPPHHSPSNIQTTLGFIRTKVEFDKMKNANVLIALNDFKYLLCAVNPDNLTPPDRNVMVYLSDRDEIVKIDVVEVFKVVQQSVCWSEL